MKKKFAIIGAGISGLTLANLIKKNSEHEFMVYEREESLSLEEGYGIQLATNSVKILNKIDSLKNKKIPFKILNIGSSKSEKLSNFIRHIEKNLKLKAKKNYLPIQMGDTDSTKANLVELKKFIILTYWNV